MTPRALTTLLILSLLPALALISGCENKDKKAAARHAAPPQTAEETTASGKGGFILTEGDREILLHIARTTLDSWIQRREVPAFDVPQGVLRDNGAAFVTLRVNGQLRGCIGHTIAQEPLWMCVRDMAVAASTKDSRFPPVRAEELDDIVVEVSVLTPPKRVKDPAEIKLGRDGVILRKGFRTGVFLPQVATETGWNRDTFLANLCSHKAGLPRDCYNDPEVMLLSFQAIVFEEAHDGQR